VFVWDRLFSTDEQSIQQSICVCKVFCCYLSSGTCFTLHHLKVGEAAEAISTVSEALLKQAEAFEASYYLPVRN